MDSPSPTEQMFLSVTPGRPMDNEMLLVGPEYTYAEDETLRYLRDQYNLAKLKAKELNTKNDVSHLKPRARKAAAKLYSAVATVIYTTISSAKTTDVERFISKRATQIPPDYFDAEYWQHVLDVAAGVRGRRGGMSPVKSAQPPTDAVPKSVVQAYLQEVQRRTRDVNAEHGRCRDFVESELSMMRAEVAETKATANEAVSKLVATIRGLQRSNESLKQTVNSLMDENEAPSGEPVPRDRTYSAEEVEQLRRRSLVENEQRRQEQLVEFLEAQRRHEEARRQTDLAIMEKHRQEFGALAFEHKEKMKDMQAKYELQIKNMSNSYNMQIEQLLAKIAVLDQVPPVRDSGFFCRDCDKQKGRIVELEANLEAQQRRVSELQQRLSSGRGSTVEDVQQTSSKLTESALYSSFSNIEDIVEKAALQKEIGSLKEALKRSVSSAAPPAPGQDDPTRELLATQLKVNKDLLNQIEDLKFRLQMLDRSHASLSSEAERREIIRKNSSLITMNYISGTVGKSVSSKIAAKIDDLQVENDSLKKQLEQEHRVSSALASQSTSLQLQELNNQVAATSAQNTRLTQQVEDLQAQLRKSGVGDDVSDLALEQCRQQLNAEIRLNEELKAVNLNMQEQLVNTTADYTKLQFQHGLTSEHILGLRQQIQELEAQRDANEKRLREAAIVGTTASLRRQHSSHMASNVVVNAIASSMQKSASMKSSSFKQSLEAEEIAQLRKTIAELQRQLTEQDMVYTERMAALQLALSNQEKKNEVLERARQQQQQARPDGAPEAALYRQVSELALKTVNESVVASVLNSIDILSRAKSVEVYGADPSVDAFDSHFSAELKNQGILIAAPGTVQGNTGWYTIDGQFMYFCNINDEFVLVCGPLSEAEHALAVSQERLSLHESTVEMNQQFGSVDRSNDNTGMGMDPNEKVIVELCALRGITIQRDRLMRVARDMDGPIDLVIPDTERRTEQDFVSLDLTKEEDDTYTMASISVDEHFEPAPQLDAIASGSVERSVIAHTASTDSAVHRALTRINSSMYVKEAPTSPASSVVSFSDIGGDSAVVSVTDDGQESLHSPRAGHQDGGGLGPGGMPNIVTTVIIKMLRKEIQHLKELSIADSQLISSLKARVYDDESTMASDTEYIKFMNKKLLSESNLHALYADESPRDFARGHSAMSLLSEDEAVINSARRPSRVPALDVVVEERGRESGKSRDPESKKHSGSDDESNKFSDPELLGVIKNLREEVHAYRGMLQDDSVVISALKQKLGLEDTDEIEIPGYIGVHSVRTSAPRNTFTDQDAQEPAESGRQDGEGSPRLTDDEGAAIDESVDLKHKVHILRNLMIQQGSQVRHLLKAIDEQQISVVRPSTVKFASDQQADMDFENFISKLDNLEKAKDELMKMHYACQDQLSVIKGYEIQVSSLQTELGDTMIDADRERDKATSALKECREDLSAARASLLAVNNQLEAIKYRNALKEDSVKSQVNKADDERYKMARKIQGRMRIFLARRRVRSVRQMLAARAANVLFAMKSTTQGETGWYAGPDGSLFYFVLDGDSWILTCGPIRPDEYEEMIEKASMALSSAQKSLVRGNVLVKCNFELSNVGDNQDLRGDLYMSAKTHKLFISLSLDTVVISDGSRIISDGGGSRTMIGSTSLVEDSSSLIQLGDAMNQGSTTLPAEPTADSS